MVITRKTSARRKKPNPTPNTSASVSQEVEVEKTPLLTRRNKKKAFVVLCMILNAVWSTYVAMYQPDAFLLESVGIFFFTFAVTIVFTVVGGLVGWMMHDIISNWIDS